MRVKISKQPILAPTASTVGPCPTLIQISKTPRHWKFTQHHRTTRPPPSNKEEEKERNCEQIQICNGYTGRNN